MGSSPQPNFSPQTDLLHSSLALSRTWASSRWRNKRASHTHVVLWISQKFTPKLFEVLKTTVAKDHRLPDTTVSQF